MQGHAQMQADFGQLYKETNLIEVAKVEVQVVEVLAAVWLQQVILTDYLILRQVFDELVLVQVFGWTEPHVDSLYVQLFGDVLAHPDFFDGEKSLARQQDVVVDDIIEVHEGSEGVVVLADRQVLLEPYCNRQIDL